MGMKFRLYITAITALAANAASATVVAESLPFAGTPDWSDVEFPGTLMTVAGGESILATDNGLGVWFGWLGSQNSPGWSIAGNAQGNYLSLTAKFAVGSDDWSAYMSDGNRFALMYFNQTPCDPTYVNCYAYNGTPGVTLYFAGATPGTASIQFIDLDTTQYATYEWLMRGDIITYRINGHAYSGTAIPTGGEQLLIIGDGSGSSPSGTGEMRISGVSFNAAPEFNTLPTLVPEPASWAMLIAGFGLIGAALRRHRAVFA
jgi:hypothetical protein